MPTVDMALLPGQREALTLHFGCPSDLLTARPQMVLPGSHPRESDTYSRYSKCKKCKTRD